MPRELLMEGLAGSTEFIVDRSKPIVFESSADGKYSGRIPGILGVIGEVNGNGRRYGKNVWENNFKTDATLVRTMGRNEALGLLEHPKDGIVSLQSPISHHVPSARIVEKRDQLTGKTVYEVHGELEFYNTPEGNKMKALIEKGYNPRVSSRGYGTLVKGPDGIDEVQSDYVCEGWDVVFKPSFEKAELFANPSNSSTAKMAQPYKPNPQAESQVPNANTTFMVTMSPSGPVVTTPTATTTGNVVVVQETKTNLKEAAPSNASGGAPAPASAPTNTKNIMEIKDIRSRISTLEALDVTKMGPARIAESVAQVEELHQSIAESCTDPKQAWEAQKLHTSLERVSSKLEETMQAPAKAARKLNENNTKLMKIINAVGQTAVTYKKKLGEALKQVTSQQKLIESLIQRGQGWQKIAESRKSKFGTLEEDFDTSTEALDIVTKRYHEDTTELARALIKLEFKDKLSEAQTKKLTEATRLRHVAAIREELEGKKPEGAVTEEKEGGKHAGVGTPKDGEEAAITKKEGDKKGEKGEMVAAAPGKVTTESKDAKGAAAAAPKEGAAAGAAPVTEAAPQTAKIVLREPSDPRGLNESVEMVKRLSMATAK